MRRQSRLLALPVERASNFYRSRIHRPTERKHTQLLLPIASEIHRNTESKLFSKALRRWTLFWHSIRCSKIPMIWIARYFRSYFSFLTRMFLTQTSLWEVITVFCWKSVLKYSEYKNFKVNSLMWISLAPWEPEHLAWILESEDICESTMENKHEWINKVSLKEKSVNDISPREHHVIGSNVEWM